METQKILEYLEPIWHKIRKEIPGTRIERSGARSWTISVPENKNQIKKNVVGDAAVEENKPVPSEAEVMNAISMGFNQLLQLNSAQTKGLKDEVERILAEGQEKIELMFQDIEDRSGKASQEIRGIADDAVKRVDEAYGRFLTKEEFEKDKSDLWYEIRRIHGEFQGTLKKLQEVLQKSEVNRAKLHDEYRRIFAGMAQVLSVQIPDSEGSLEIEPSEE